MAINWYTRTAETISDLRKQGGAPGTVSKINVLGYYAKGDGGGNTFYWDEYSTAADNGGTVIQVNNAGVSGGQTIATGRWIGMISRAGIDIRTFGAKDDVSVSTGIGSTGTDNTTFIQNAINAASVRKCPVIVPLSSVSGGLGGYGITNTLMVPANVDLICNGILYLDLPADSTVPAVQIGTESATVYRNRSVIQASRPTTKFSDWSSVDGNDCALRVVNLFSSEISILYARGFTTGLLCDAVVNGNVDVGVSYSKFNIINLWNNRQHIMLRTRRDGGIGIPFVNENDFRGGNLTFSSGGSNQNNKARYGVRVEQVGGVGSHNNNRFTNMSFELGTSLLGGNESLPVLFRGNVGNHYFVSCRAEANASNGIFARLENGDYTGSGIMRGGNEFEISFTDTITDIDDRTDGIGNYIRFKYDKSPTMYNVCATGDLSKLSKGYTNGVSVPGYSFINPGVSPVQTNVSTACTLHSGGGLSLTSNNYIGNTVDTSTVKSYFVSKRSITSGRIRIICYDDNFVQLGNPPVWAATTAYSLNSYISNSGKVYQCTVAGTSGSTGPTHTSGTAVDGTVTWSYVGTSKNFPFKSNNPFGVQAFSTLTAVYFTQSDSADRIQIVFHSHVKKAFIGISGGTLQGAKGFEIKSLDNKAEIIKLTAYDTLGLSANEPSFGYYTKGEVSYFDNNSSGETLGWQCYTAGFACTSAWVATTAYALNDIRYFSGNVYLCTVAGTSGSTGPTHTSGTAVDGTVTWSYVGAKAAFSACSYVAKTTNVPTATTPITDASVSVSGTALYGTITLTLSTSQSLATLGELFTMTFPVSAVSRVVLFHPSSALAASVLAYTKAKTTTTNQVATQVSGTFNNGVYSWDYIVIK